MSAKLENVYYQRQAGTERPCYVCRAFTATVLSTIKTEDFIYVCEKHLKDPASEIPDPTPAGPSAADIAKVVDEHKAKEAAREAKAKAKAAGGDAADKDKDKDKLDASSEKAKETTTSRPTTPSLSGIPSPSSTAAAKGKHKMYALHRSMFAMRVREHKQREQGVKAKEVGKGESPDYCNMCANGDL